MRADKYTKNKKNKTIKFKDIFKELIIALVITCVVLIFVSPTMVKEHSMQPTINDGDYLLLNKLLYQKPKYGDIVVFKSDIEKNDKKDINLIKRIIGVEGDIITINNDKLFRNGYEVKEKYIYKQCPGEIYNFVVPKGQVFVLGDHREVSIDSRQFGPIDEDKIIGKAFVRIYPFKNFGIIK